MAAQPHGNIVRHNFKNPAHGVPRFQDRVNFRLHFFLHRRINAPQRRIQVRARGVNFFPGGRFFQTHVADLNCVARDFRFEFPQEQFCKSASRHSRSRFARGSSLQNVPRIVVVEFLRPRKIRMARARRNKLSRGSSVFRGFHRQDFFPIRPIAILDPQRNRRPDGLPVAHSGKNFRAVLFDLLPPAPSIAKLAPPQLVIDELHVNGHLRRQPGDKRQQRLSMRFTRGVKPKHARSFLARICAQSLQNKWKTNSVAAASRCVQQRSFAQR